MPATGTSTRQSLTDINDTAHYKRATEAMEGIFRAAVELGGVLSGEHGIGLEKQKFFSRITDPVVINIMKGIKALMDPNNIMNPGKIWSEGVPRSERPADEQAPPP